MEEFFIELLKEYGYIILFVWCIMEGEMALIMAGILAHTTHMHIALAIFVAGLGGFVGDQIYFYLGRYNKKYIAKRLHTQRRKFAVAHIMLKKYGWPIIFLQRYMYGFRVIIPLCIGLTGYDHHTCLDTWRAYISAASKSKRALVCRYPSGCHIYGAFDLYI